MDIITQIMNWLELNWGTAVFGSVTLGGIIGTAYILVKQYLGTKAQGTKYEKMWNASQETITKWATLYQNEKAKSVEVQQENAFLKASQTVMFDAITKMALASKLDSEDKVSIVTNIDRLSLMAPTTIVNEVKEKSEAVIENVSKELEQKPVQTVFNVINTAGSLLEKYTTKKE